MDKGKFLNNEQGAIGSLGDSIVSLILNEGKVVIPELGYLELKVFPDKRTVLFKATENATLFLVSEGSIQSHIYDDISIPLKEGKIVTLPEVGIFHPIKKEDGTYRISFTISSSLRKVLNGAQEEEKANDKSAVIPIVESPVKEQQEDKGGKEEVEVKEGKEDIVEKAAAENNKKTPERVVIPTPRERIRVDNRKIHLYRGRNASDVGDTVVPQDEKTRINATKKRGIIAVAVALIALILIVWYFLPESKGQKGSALVSDNTESKSPTHAFSEAAEYSKFIDLPALAEQKYGNRVFWVYIYEANRDKISSPVNIPVGTDIRIPNLWEDYKVDVRDSVAIRNAGQLSETVLKRDI